MADITIDFNEANPPFNPDDFKVIEDTDFTIKVAVPPGFSMPAVGTPNSTLVNDFTGKTESTGSPYIYKCKVSKYTGSFPLTVTTSNTQGMEERTSSGSIEVSAPKEEEG